MLRELDTVLATISTNFIQILTTNIKGGLTVAAKALLLKFIQLLTMLLIPLRLAKTKLLD